jgi:hypothetical protein
MVRSGRRAFLHRARVAREHEDVESFRHIRNELIEYWYAYIEQEDRKKENMNRKMSRMLETDTYPSHEAYIKSGGGSSISEPQSPITLDAQKMAAEGIPMQGNQTKYTVSTYSNSTDQQTLRLRMMQRMQRMQAYVSATTNTSQAGSSSNNSSSVDNTHAISSPQSLPSVHSQMSQIISRPIHIPQQLQAQAQHMRAQLQAQYQAQLQAQYQAQQQAQQAASAAHRAQQAQQAEQQAWHSLPRQSSPPQNDPNHCSLPPPNKIVGSPESMSTSCMIRQLPRTLKTSDTVPPPVSVAQAAMPTQYQPSAHSTSMHSTASARTTAAPPQYEANCLDPMTSTWLDNYSPTTETIDLTTADNANAPSSSSSRVRKRSASSSGTSTTVHESTGTEEVFWIDGPIPRAQNCSFNQSSGPPAQNGEEPLAKKRRLDASLEEHEDMCVSTDTGGGNDGSVVFEMEVDEDGYISFDSDLVPGWDGVGKGKGKVAWSGVN